MNSSATYYSHSKYVDGLKVGSKKLTDHIKGIDKIVSAAKGVHHPSISTQQQKALLHHLVKFHDIGKYTSYFQNYLLGKYTTSSQLKNHSKIGAYTIYNYYREIDERLSVIAYYLVKSHHSNLVNFVDDPLFSTDRILLEHQFQKQVDDLLKIISQIEAELELSNFHNFLKFPDRSIRHELKAIARESEISNYFLINYLFSVLIEADKLDASDTPLYRSKPIPQTLVENYINNFNQDELKNSVRKTVTSTIDDDNFQYEGRLFTLTAPTGIGKTLTALDFALKIREKHFALSGENKKIIYALPFINIIEQAIEVYSEVIHDKGKVLAHYQFSTPDDNESNYNRYLMMLETWQADIIITTFVQLLETIISNNNSALKKFHHLQNSILILDEVQAIDLKKLPLIGAVLHYLSKFMNTTVLLMTATKPLIFELANEILLRKENCTYTELLPNHPEIFQKFNRTKIVPHHINKKIEIDHFLDMLKEEAKDCNSILVVFNKIDTSLNYFYSIQGLFVNEGYTVLYLSTNLTHSHRLKVIHTVKELIKKNEKVILISTQSIEAGVDLSFEIGFRDLAPLDSIIQVAGRVNRVNDATNQNAPVFVFNLGDCKTIYGSLTEDVVLSLLSDKSEILEENYLELIEQYFNDISSRRSFDEAIDFFNAMKNLDYTNSSSGKSISDFQVIKANDFKISVFIEYDATASTALQKFKEYIQGNVNKEGFEPYKSNFYRSVVQVPKSCESEFSPNQKLTDNIFLVEKDQLDHYYNSETGFIRIEEQKTQTSINL